MMKSSSAWNNWNFKKSSGSSSRPKDEPKDKVHTNSVNTTDRVKYLEHELQLRDEELKEKNNTLKCLQELRSGVGLRSNAADFYHIKDKECRQLIHDVQSLYRDLEDFNETVNFENKSKYEPPGAPVSRLMTSSNFKNQHNNIKSYGANDMNSKFANIKGSWEEHTVRIIDLNDRLKAAYDYIKEVSGGKPAEVEKNGVMGPITTNNIARTSRVPTKEPVVVPSQRNQPQSSGVTQKQKNLLLQMGGVSSESISDDENVYNATPARAYIDSGPTIFQAQPTAQTTENGNKPDWLNDDGEIVIVPVKASLLDSISAKADEMAGKDGFGNHIKSSANADIKASPEAAQVKTEFYKGNQRYYPPSVDESKLGYPGVQGDVMPISAPKPTISTTYQQYNTGSKNNNLSYKPQPASMSSYRQPSNGSSSDCD